MLFFEKQRGTIRKQTKEIVKNYQVSSITTKNKEEER